MRHRRRLAVVLGINQTMSWGVTFYLPAIIADPAAHTLHASPMAVLGAFSWALLVTGFCAPRVGRWIDTNGGRGVLSLSVLVLAAGLVLLAAAPGPTMWYAAWSVLGVGMALGLYDAAFATVGTLLGREAGPIITGITLIAGLASTVFWSLGAGLIGMLGWRGLLLFYAG
ncbi:MAG TPA: MFS transporter, partial [Acetobacteraceae bacterium]|nr:MFS transporter [Acetobacteraceae bacterium]